MDTVKEELKIYPATSKNIMMLLGDDFKWENAHYTFYNYDRLLHYINRDTNKFKEINYKTIINVRYSTASEYV